MSFIELYEFIICQHLNTRIKILPLATSQIAHLCNQFNHVCTANFSATHYFFIKIALNLSYFCKKMQIFELWGHRTQTPLPSPAGASAPITPNTAPPLRISGFASGCCSLFLNVRYFLALFKISSRKKVINVKIKKNYQFF